MQLLKKTFAFGLIGLFLSFGFIAPAVADRNDGQIDAVNRIKDLADQGNPNAQYLLAALYQQADDHHKAFQWFEKSALQGDDSSESKVGLMYYAGLGVRQNFFKAFEFSLKAANKKVHASYLPVAAMYELGQGVRQDSKKAKEWYGKYCDNGYQLGCDKYRELNEKGR